MVEEQQGSTTFSPTNAPLSPPQIHQKIIYTWSNFHKPTSQCQWGTPDTRNARLSFQKKVGQKIIDEKRDKGLRDSDLTCRGSHVEVSTQQETLSQRGSVKSSGISESNIMGRKKKKITTEFSHQTALQAEKQKAHTTHFCPNIGGARQGTGYITGLQGKDQA